ncbi:SRPBCC family protein [Saccharopolyspora sp. CA-218241]|uniref:SRPBCC family protein n=1 Tax=Saccharopolyspora sp. CA-218241 TaxID=3240027 RepID=UPI003D9540DD
MRRAEVRVSVPVAADPETVWAVATDWPRQGEWMLGTEVSVLGGSGGTGTELLAVTGYRGVGAVDRMRVVEFEPPRICRVRHEGGLIVGEGGFEVVRCGNLASTFAWWERLELPTGTGPLWPAVRPALRWGLRRSLRTFAELCRAEGDRG